MAYHNGGEVGQAADRLGDTLSGAGILLCMIAPFFGAAALRRKFLFCILGGVAGFAAGLVSGFVIMYFVVGF
jgi:hypothetical protein